MRPSTSIAKVHRVFSAFGETQWLGVAQLARATGLLPSDVHRILRSLEQFGFIEQHPGTREYRLGAELLRLGQLVRDRLGIRTLARPILCQLMQDTGAVVTLLLLAQPSGQLVVVDHFDCAAGRAHRLLHGPLAHSLEGMVLFAHLAPPAFDTAMQQVADADRPLLQHKLEILRKQGYGADWKRPGGRMLACAPLVDGTTAIGVISLEASLSDLAIGEEQQVIEHLKASARRLSQASESLPVSAACSLPGKSVIDGG